MAGILTAKLFTYAQIGLATLLIAGIMLQQRGTGLSSTFGGSSMEYSTKRGVEKVVFYATIIFAALFIVVSITRLVLLK